MKKILIILLYCVAISGVCFAQNDVEAQTINTILLIDGKVAYQNEVQVKDIDTGKYFTISRTTHSTDKTKAEMIAELQTAKVWFTESLPLTLT